MEDLRLKWKQSPTHPNIYVRDLLGAELIVDRAHICQNGNYYPLYLVRFHIDPKVLSGEDLQRRIKCAWKEVRRNAPQLAIQVCGPPSGRYFRYERPKSEAAVDKWVERSCHIFEFGTDFASVQDFREAFPSETQTSYSTFYPAESEIGKSPDHLDCRCKAFLNVSPGEHIIAISCHHSLSDGIGGVQICSNLIDEISFNEYGSVPWDLATEHERLSPAFYIQLGIRKEGEALPPASAAALDELIAKIVSFKGLYTDLCPNDYSYDKATPKIYTEIINKDATHKIKLAFKVKGYTITQAFNAASAVACQTIQVRKTGVVPDKFRQMSFHPCNMRQHYLSEFKLSKHHYEVSIINIPGILVVDGIGEIDDRIKMEILSREWLNSTDMLLWQHEMNVSLLSNLSPSFETPIVPKLSSIGNVDSYFRLKQHVKGGQSNGCLTVLESNTQVRLCGPEVLIHVTGINGEIYWTASYDSQWHSEKSMKEFFEETRRLLLLF
ncbi:hypothetical protein NEOLI_004826 [Neolecta irregularis DAH-3]|uniref:Uncharacterized protein n=1 Tax=Neolecta irregularis (strain DAH-3) TaxID=1198029 RepID=A0A1U7LKD9_NEOID|nr:hypothetical protein NEOLI_004826 [Neolecta irregularis DAH-3]|eukprot:OLL23012.1 hypothetical protein NEOLI_004826 [Neolecta irregularis DAH-3]